MFFMFISFSLFNIISSSRIKAVFFFFVSFPSSISAFFYSINFERSLIYVSFLSPSSFRCFIIYWSFSFSISNKCFIFYKLSSLSSNILTLSSVAINFLFSSVTFDSKKDISVCFYIFTPFKLNTVSSFTTVKLLSYVSASSIFSFRNVIYSEYFSSVRPYSSFIVMISCWSWFVFVYPLITSSSNFVCKSSTIIL